MSLEQREREFHFSDSDFHELVGIVGKRTGIKLAEHKRSMVYSRLARRLRALGFTQFRQYIQLITAPEGEGEITDFVNAITTNLTKFFREEHHFTHLRDRVLKPLAAHPPLGKRVRMWSAGCSSGMECYSMAMTAQEAIPDIERWDFKILATDIDTNMLKKGQEGIYRKEDAEAVPPEYRKKYLVRHGGAKADEVQVIDKLRALSSFKYLNFISEPWPVKGLFDVIFCRNVVIYFDKETQRRLFAKFAEMLKPQGWLYIGHSENLMGVSDSFESLGKTVYRKIA